MTDMRTPLGRVRGHGSAKNGTGTFWRQRLTAIANIPLVVFLLASIVTLAGSGYETAYAYLSMPVVTLVLLALIVSGVMHMHIGMKEIIEDYVHNEKLKLLAVLGNTFFSMMIGLACAFAALKLGLTP